jgi:molybdopterin-guanine dinucleotide biosynthesis protein A
VPSRDRASLGILAGGRGLRLGGVDKAAIEVQGVSLLQRVLDAAGSGFAQVLVSHNRPDAPLRAHFHARALRFVADDAAAGEGPLAGLDALLQACQGEWLLTLPVDLAHPSRTLVDALLAQEGAVARDAEGLQPLVALWPVAPAREAVREALARGDRAVHPLVARLGLHAVDTPRLGNLNTPQDFQDLA